MTTDKVGVLSEKDERAAFEAEFPLAVWDADLKGYTQPMYSYAWIGFKLGRAALANAPGTCEWEPNRIGLWETACNRMGSDPHKRGMKFCPYCGKNLTTPEVPK